MKKIITVLGIAGLVAGALGLFLLFSATISADHLAPAAMDKNPAFAEFPAGQSRTVSFEADAETRELLSPREWRDQMLDWLLLTVLSSARLSLDDFNSVTYDLPPSRSAYMRAVGSFEYGESRSRYIGNGQVIVLIPADATPAVKADHVVRSFDEHRKNQGVAPKTLTVFEYAINPDQVHATATRTQSVDGARLLSSENGYRSRKVTSLVDLTQFMKEIDTLLGARIEANQLVVEGRKVGGQGYRGIRVEDVAAIWQSQRAIDTKKKEFDARWDTRRREVDQKWRSKQYTKSEVAEAQRAYDGEMEEVLKNRAREAQKLSIVQGSGFSLDPTFDYPGLLNAVVSAERQSQSMPLKGRISAEEWARAKKGLEDHDVFPMLAVMDKLTSPSPGDASNREALLEKMSEKFGFQAARYDGELQGTEVGMVLFYTDLVAKLWALDFAESTPSAQVPEFQSIRETSVSPIYDEETIELPGTRLWFGPQSKGFQVLDAKASLLMTRNATRVYAASNNPLEPGIEKEAAAWSETFLGWWNDHYEEIARFEPEYERLNEVMKWSLLVSWLTDAGKLQLLDSLDAVKVDRSNRFPEWSAKREELRFRSWPAIQFYPKGYKGVTTETLPLLHSKLYVQRGSIAQLSGGVSLADRSLFEGRVALPTERKPLLSRSNVDYSVDGSGVKYIKTLDGAKYEFPSTGTMRVSASDKAKLRTRDTELVNGEFARTVQLEGARLSVRAQVGSKEIGELNIERQAGGFGVSWHARDVDLGQSLARAISKSTDPLRDLLGNPDVEVLIALDDDGGYVVKLRGSRSWLKLAPEEKPSVSVAKGWDGRASDTQSGFQNIQVAWRDTASVAKEFEVDGFISIEQVPGNERKLLRYHGPRGPPSGEATAEVTAQGKTIKARADPAAKRLIVRWGDLPEDLRADVGKLNQVAYTLDMGPLGVRGADAKPIQIVSRFDGRGPPSEFVAAFNEDPKKAIRFLVDDPKGGKAHIDRLYAQQLQEVDSLLVDKDYERAIRHLTVQTAMFGPRPELLLRRGLAKLGEGRAELAMHDFKAIKFQSLGARDRFLDELSVRASQSLDPLARQQLDRGIAYAIWSDGKPAGNVDLIPSANGLKLSFQSTDKLAGDDVAAIEVNGVKAGDFNLYVQDSPRLNNVDWSGSLESSLRQVVNNGWGRLVRLSGEDVGRFAPDEVVSLEVTLKLKSTAKGETSAARYADGVLFAALMVQAAKAPTRPRVQVAVRARPQPQVKRKDRPYTWFWLTRR